MMYKATVVRILKITTFDILLFKFKLLYKRSQNLHEKPYDQNERHVRWWDQEAIDTPRKTRVQGRR